ncbi:MAG: ferrochelatase [Opitutaceae bacterium]
MPKRAVLLFNLGSPDSTSIANVRKYLREFLGDDRVLDFPAWRRWMLLEGIILRTRPRHTARAYAKIWTPEGSPLIRISRAVADRLGAALASDASVYLGMRYGRPSTAEAVARSAADGVEELLLFPQYPHYAMSSWETGVVRAREEIACLDRPPRVDCVPPFYADPDYIEALYAASAPALSEPFDHVLFSYHGLPERHLRQTDPSHAHCLTVPDCCEGCSPVHATCYRAQCLATTRALAGRLGLPADRHSVSFQSRLGREPWLRPFTDHELVRLPKAGMKRLAVLSPAFVADCLETLEEIAMTGRDAFLAAGGETFRYIPCPNDQEPYLRFLAGRVRRWLEQGSVPAGRRGGEV